MRLTGIEPVFNPSFTIPTPRYAQIDDNTPFIFIWQYPEKLLIRWGGYIIGRDSFYHYTTDAFWSDLLELNQRPCDNIGMGGLLQSHALPTELKSVVVVIIPLLYIYTVFRLN